MIQPVSVRPSASPKTGTLCKVLMGPVTLNQSGAKEKRAAEELEQFGECFSTLCSKQNMHVIIGDKNKRIPVKM